MSDTETTTPPTRFAVHVTRMEQVALLNYVQLPIDKGGFRTAGRNESRRFTTAFIEFGLEALRVMNDNTPITQEWTKGPDKVLEVSKDALEYVLTITDREKSTEFSRILLPLEERLFSAKEGRYKLPERLARPA